MKVQQVVWFEGMKLDPHHFQQMDRYNQYYINSKLHFIFPNNWGLSEIAVDTAILSGGSFGIISCSGVMPDGLIFSMPENDPVPKARSFTDYFSATSEKLEVFLAIPAENQAGNNCQLSETNGHYNTRFYLQNTDIPDYNSGSNTRTVAMVKPNFQLRFGDESLDGFTSIKISEIIRNSDGKFSLNKNYIFPSLTAQSSEMLMQYLRDVLGGLISKSKELREQAGIQKQELSITQVEILLMLHSVNTMIPLLTYYYKAPHIHPEHLYVMFLNIAGQLSTFSDMGFRQGEYPPYDHKHLSEIFSNLVNDINVMLNVQKTLTRRDINVPLRKQSDSIYIGQLSPQYMSAFYYIAVQGDMSEKKIITEFPKNIKISSYEEIFAVSQAGIQGVTVEYIARPQSGITINERAHYFKINKEGRFWDKIVAKNNIAFFITTEFKHLQIELILLTT